MTEFYSTKLAVGFWAAMLLVAIFVLFVVLGAVDLAPRHKSRHASIDPNKELLLVNVVFRHGPRTPADTYPNDPHVNETFYPYGWGQITNEGKKFMYETGKWLRSRYGNFLGDEYVPDAVWVQTTGVPRTKVSMQTLLAGLFPPKGTDLEWNHSLNWQPIPIYSQDLDEDTLLLVRTPCPRYYEAVDEVLELPEVKKVLDENKQLFAELTEHTGLTIQTPDDVQSLYGTLRAESEYGLELPEWTNEYYPHRLENLTELSYIYNIYTEEMKKVKAGPFLKKLSTEFEAKRNETIKPAERKISLYCGHDSTVVNILSGLNVWKQQMPVYGIMTLIELVRDRSTDEIGVQIYLRTSSKRSAIPLVIPGCDHFCPLDKFIQICQRVIPEEGEAICKPRNQYYVTPAMSGP